MAWKLQLVQHFAANILTGASKPQRSYYSSFSVASMVTTLLPNPNSKCWFLTFQTITQTISSTYLKALSIQSCTASRIIFRGFSLCVLNTGSQRGEHKVDVPALFGMCSLERYRWLVLMRLLSVCHLAFNLVSFLLLPLCF